MNPTETILLTALVNIIITGLISGVAVYRIQKRIDSSIQKSLFEFQTKYSRSYPKMLEVLEALCTKYLEYVDAANECCQEILGKSQTSHDELLQGNFEDCQTYLFKHRMFLPDSTVEELDAIMVQSTTLNRQILKFKSLTRKSEKALEAWLLEEVEEKYLPKLKKNDLVGYSFYVLYFGKRLGELSGRVEDHYKTLAQLNN